VVAIILGPPGADVVRLALAMGSRVSDSHFVLVETHARTLTNHARHANHNTIAS
jgi:hypothetical protein